MNNRIGLARFTILVFSTILFVLLLPLVLKVDFMQNDDWVYYQTIENFLRKDFVLAPLVGVTFYTQGFFAFIFAKIFGLYNLPILTLLFSVLNFVVLSTILKSQYKTPLFISILLGLLLFFNPLHFYSILGFMSENYVLFFLLGGVYFVNRYLDTNNITDFFATNIMFILGFFVKQYLVVSLISLTILLLIKRKYKHAYYELIITVLLLSVYYFYFPMTDVMKNQSLNLSQLLNFSSMYSLFYVISVYTWAMLIPLVFAFVYRNISGISYIKILGFFLISIVLYFALTKLFLLSYYPLKDFPYLTNTFDRKGFFPGSLGGNKYIWKGVYDVMKYWEFISIGAFSLFTASFLNLRKIKFSNVHFEHVFFIMYFVLLLVTSTIYDRYLIPLIAIAILILAKSFNKIPTWVSAVPLIFFLFFLLILNYEFSMEYVKRQNYIWNKSEYLSSTEILEPGHISSIHSWNNYYLTTNDYKYKFSYDSPDKFIELDKMNLVETEKIDFFGNMFINSNIYLYER